MSKTHLRKKFYLSLLVATFFLPTFTHAYFDDVPQNHEAYEAIIGLRNKRIVEGFSEDGKSVFMPDQEVTRAEFLKMAYLAEAKRSLQRTRIWDDPEFFPFDRPKSVKIEPPCFNDFKSFRSNGYFPEWFEVYACWGKAQGLVEGYEGGNFDPLRTVNFAEAAKILIETSGQPVAEQVEHWAQGYIEALNIERIIPSSIRNASQPLNRAMAAQLIYNYNQAAHEDLQAQSSNALIWEGQKYVLFENLGIVGPHYQLLKRDGEVYCTFLFGLDGPSHNYKKLENVDEESLQAYQYYDRISYSGNLKYIMAGVATDQFSVFDSRLNPIEGSAGGPFQFFEDSFQVIPDNYIGYGRDSEHVYLINCYEGCWPEILPDSNADDFVVIGNGFSKSGDQYYYRSQPIDLSINIDELEFLTPILGKKGDQVYYFQPDIGEGWQVRKLNYLGMINLRTPDGGNRDLDYDEYYMNDGKDIFMLKSGIFQKIDGADVNSFRLVNWEEKSLFAMDDGVIYLNGSPLAESKLKSFEVLGDPFELYRSTKVGYYISDGEGVYLASCWQLNQCEMRQVPVGGNGKSFNHLGEGYGFDDAQAYYAGQPLEADLNTLTYLGEGYLKDKDHVYYPNYFVRDEVVIDIMGADPKSFELNLPNDQGLFCTLPFAKDMKNLYLAGRVMKSIDPQDGVLLPGSSFMEDIDYESFEFLDENGFFFKDKNGVYRVNVSSSCLSRSWEKLDPAEAASFKSFKPHYYGSQGQVYFIERYSDVLLSQADEATFEPLVKNFNDSVDLEYAYVAKDANFAYYKQDVIPLNIDVASFGYDPEKNVLHDKNKQYTLQEIETILEECAYEYAPVCGQLKEEQQSFRNSCLAKKDGAKTITDGLCTDQEKTWEQACLNVNHLRYGTPLWYPEWQYCSHLDEITCYALGGKEYNDCGSGCSPYDDSEVCPSVCVELCFFN